MDKPFVTNLRLSYNHRDTYNNKLDTVSYHRNLSLALPTPSEVSIVDVSFYIYIYFPSKFIYFSPGHFEQYHPVPSAYIPGFPWV